MSDKVKDPLDDAIIQFEFTVAQVNAILNILGQAPYMASANLIALIQAQGESQFKKLVEAIEIVKKTQENNEPKATS
jgi:hypothetical protein